MIAIEQIRRDPETVRRAMESRGEPDQVDVILELDAAWRRDRTDADEIRNRRNQVNREIGHARSAGQAPAPEVIEEMRTLGRRVDELEASAQDAEEQVRQLLLNLPNLPWIAFQSAPTLTPTASTARRARPQNWASRPFLTGTWPNAWASSISNGAPNCPAAGSTLPWALALAWSAP